tara:strand:- start:1590 stop:2774 length:1185 start_codon:yes stop_codon:yes gene_type:complete
MAEGINSRLCALNTLMAVFDGGQPLDVALDKNAVKLSLFPQDKSFAHALCGFVLRHKDGLQKAVNAAANRQQDVTPSALNILLLIGAAQIYLMGVADHAAVNISVDLTYKIKCSKQKGLVNAVLRRLLREGQKEIKPALPQWLLQSWVADYDTDTAKALEEASLKEAGVGISDKTGQWQGLESFSELTSDQWVQDYSSHYPVSLLGDLTGKIVFDLCAAPGGKTMQLAAKGAKVAAVDISEKRLKRLQENLHRTQLADKVTVECADILKWQPDKKADYIILDAPCSATGTIRRHPDLPYIRSEKDINVLVKLQAQLLDKAKSWLNPEGVLVYCTCSLQKDEGERQVEIFLKNNPHFCRMIKGDEKYHNEQGDMRLLPTYGDMDGFFISYLQFTP